MVWFVGFAIIWIGLAVLGIARARGTSTGRTVISRHDEMYALPPGALPPRVGGAPTRPATMADVNAPIAVRFEPPTGVMPEQVGMLRDASVQSADVAAAIIAMAVDGHLHIQPVQTMTGLWRKRPTTQWQITVLRPAEPSLPPLRRALLQMLGTLGPGGTLDDLKPLLVKDLPDLKQELAAHPQHESWYPRMREGKFSLGACLTTPGAKQRSAMGTALRYQLAGFVHYLEVADANQLRFEEGAGIFSRYLPWAVAAGVTKQWVAAFREAARGMSDADVATSWASDLAWYGSFCDFDPNTFDSLGEGLGDMMDSLGDALADLESGITDLASDLTDAGSSGDSGGDGGGDGGGGGD